MTSHASHPNTDGRDPTQADGADAGAGESFGRYLARERELRGMSLEQIAEQTRIGTSNLRALEQDDVSRLPARVFVLGYIRAYAQAIGLNPDEAVLRYEEMMQKSQPATDEDEARRPRRRRLVALLVVVVLLAAVAGAWLLMRQ
ncbi:MAG: helix-turn-helix domain-containing protein [Myxococcales bacterium]|jgi:cytoskeletal protein RodZ